MHITCIEVDKFKSFGRYTRIPLRDGFTVVSGPNGSGKSNIIDALLFALGLSDARGLRAGKLSDLVHQGMTKGEVVVTVTLTGPEETLTVARRLRVSGSNCTSTYIFNSRPCTLTELHDELARRRIYPQGYNVVLQGDVTDIISMNGRERREIIDELAGVADFDRKIILAKRELSEVQAQEERLRFVEHELQQALERLSQERQKAQEYQQLRAQLAVWQAYGELFTLARLATQLQVGAEQLTTLHQQITATVTTQTQTAHQLTEQEAHLTHWQNAVKQLGEEEQLTLQTALTAARLQLEQTQQQQQDLNQHQTQLKQQQQQLTSEAQRLQVTPLDEQRTQLDQQLSQTRLNLRDQQQQLDRHRERLRQLSQSSESWVQQQTTLNQRLQQLQQTLTPLQQTLTRLAERLLQQRQQQQDTAQEAQATAPQLQEQTRQLTIQTQAVSEHTQRWESLRAQVSQQQGQLLTDKSTLRRLEKEYQQLCRELDQIEARQQATRELDGQGAVQAIVKANLSGVHGPILHLAQVPAEYQLALEVAAGGRLFNVVVDDDGVGAEAIELLKQQRAGRATFLPLAQLRDPARLLPLREEGVVGYAVELLEFAPCYRRAFAYVFGDTVVFHSLELARRQLGRYRMVTLGGELLEKSGAMTGGSQRQRSGNLWRGAVEVPQAQQSRRQDLETMIQTLSQRLETQEHQLQQLQQQAQQAERLSVLGSGQQQQGQREVQRLQQRLDHLLTQREHLAQQHQQDQQAQTKAQTQVAPLETEISQLQQQLAGLKTYSVYQEWQALQRTVTEADQHRQHLQQQVFTEESQIQQLETQRQLNQQRQQDLTHQQAKLQAQLTQAQTHRAALTDRHLALQTQVAELQTAWHTLEAKLQHTKAQRDHWEKVTQETRRQVQTCQWQQEQLQEKVQHHQQALNGLQDQYAAQQEICAPHHGLQLPPDLTP
ncbi:chromosome segregation protein SMC, partial [Candidatus Cyanaurora vandensis]|uniref:chromosome segregation protein SMC n=2 Tax=Candidatus Cyanaurora vandensis TaxID=2714958 RepID=UPI00257B2542